MHLSLLESRLHWIQWYFFLTKHAGECHCLHVLYVDCLDIWLTTVINRMLTWRTFDLNQQGSYVLMTTPKITCCYHLMAKEEQGGCLYLQQVWLWLYYRRDETTSILWWPKLKIDQHKLLATSALEQWSLRAAVPKLTMIVAPFLRCGIFLALIGTTVWDCTRSHAIQNGGTRESQKEEATRVILWWPCEFTVALSDAVVRRGTAWSLPSYKTIGETGL